MAYCSPCFCIRGNFDFVVLTNRETKRSVGNYILTFYKAMAVSYVAEDIPIDVQRNAMVLTYNTKPRLLESELYS